MEALKYSDENSFTFKVDDIEPNRKCDLLGNSAQEILLERVDQSNYKFDDFSHKDDTETRILLSNRNGLMSAAHFAYVYHRPLRVSVSDFILMIAQGIAAHLEIHAEDVRPFFVNHEGKEKIVIQRPDFNLEGGNDWSAVFGEFTAEVQKRVKMDFYDIMVDDTSVATKLSRISSEIAIMDSFKHYFEYEVMVGCAMTEITLVGSKEDWEKLRTKVTKLKEFNTDDRLQLDWWLDRLVPVVDKIVDQAVSRKIDRSFWSKIYQSGNLGVGGGEEDEEEEEEEVDEYAPTPLINGWLNIFNPYILKYQESHEDMKLDYARSAARSSFENIHPDELMNGVCKAPILMHHIITGENHPMTVYGGFLGAKINDDGTIGTEYFYAATFDDCPENKDVKGIKI